MAKEENTEEDSVWRHLGQKKREGRWLIRLLVRWPLSEIQLQLSIGSEGD